MVCEEKIYSQQINKSSKSGVSNTSPGGGHSPVWLSSYPVPSQVMQLRSSVAINTRS